MFLDLAPFLDYLGFHVGYLLIGFLPCIAALGLTVLIGRWDP